MTAEGTLSMSDFDRRRAEVLMRDARIDALVLFQPENYSYAIGAPAGVAAMWRRAGGAIAVMPGDPQSAPVAIVGDLQAEAIRARSPGLDIREHPLWVDTVDISGIDRDGRTPAEIVTAAYRRVGRDGAAPRPTTFDLKESFGRLADVLAEKGLGRSRIGADFGFLPVADFERLKSETPHVAWVDGSDVIRRLRAIKTPAEIDRLRSACLLAEAGLVYMADRIAGGQSRGAVAKLWRDGMALAARTDATVSLSGSWDYVAVGPDPWSPGGIVERGSIVKADVGCLIEGYSSDTARTYVFGTPDPIARDVYAALLDAFETGIGMIRPGVELRHIHAATTAAIHKAGYHGYGRGHFGHGLGASVGSEEWPFIAADSDVVAEPGMVLAFETPFYGKGIGALMIEDQLLVTETGIEVMVTLPRTLTVLG